MERLPAGWHAYCPVLEPAASGQPPNAEQQGASTWGETQDEALKNIIELVRMVVESMLTAENASRANHPISSRMPSHLAWQ